MNVAMAFNPAAFARSTNAPTQAQVNAQVSAGSGSDFARDKVSRTSQRENMRNAMLGKVSQKKLMLQAAKVGGKKRA